MAIANIRAVIGRTIVLGIATVTLVIALSAAPAEAAIGSITAKLTVTRVQPGYSDVRVEGVVPMTEAEARGLIDSGHKVMLRLWGDDPVSDDLLHGPYQSGFFVVPDKGLGIRRVLLRMSHRVLNEDVGGDELYVGVRLVNSAGATIRSRETNRVNGYF